MLSYRDSRQLSQKSKDRLAILKLATTKLPNDEWVSRDLHPMQK